VWPVDNKENTELLAAAQAALQARSPLVKAAGRSASAGPGRILSLPVRSGKQAVGAIALELKQSGPERVQTTLAEMDQAAQGLGAALAAPPAATAPAAEPASAILLRVQAALLSHERFAAAAAALVNEIAAAWRLDGACFGMLDGDDVEVVARAHRGEP